ncbi:putative diacylglycerol O-acyltransferase tgs1 [Microbotryomycetes sp. JL201]|nr:putative diacylglycerol O-acyltransferase tgs1 [Microbotryomycetes sp. JL201]
MRSGRASRADAISNSPIVRALIKPVKVVAPPGAVAATNASQALSVNATSMASSSEAARPEERFLLPTQPPTKAVSAGTSDVKGKKRARDDAEDDRHTAEQPTSLSQAVQTRYTEDNLPKELAKYWFQRYRLFSLFDKGCELDLEGWYSVTPEKIAKQIAERCRTNVIVDAFCGVGGNAIQFAMTCEKVIAIDNSPVRLQCAKRNAEIYGVGDHIQFVLADFVDWTNDYVVRKSAGLIPENDQVEVVFMSPPWGGIEYRSIRTQQNGAPSMKATTGPTGNANGDTVQTNTSDASEQDNPAEDTELSYPLSALKPLPGQGLFTLARQITPHVAMFLPRNVDMHEVARLPALAPRTDQPDSDDLGQTEFEYSEPVEVEEQWMSNKLKAVTAYFGDLAANSKTSWVQQAGTE